MRRILSRRTMPDTQPIKDYLCVGFPTGGTLQLTGNKPTTMEYVAFSKNGRNWTKYTSNGSMSANAGEKIYVKGSGSAMGKGSGGEGWRFDVSNGLCNLSGNIMSLLYDDDFEDKTEVGKNAFAHVFLGGFISDVSELKFPATTVGDYAYYSMFSCGGSSLAHPFTKPPKLPATTLGAGCYAYMFSSSNLDEMPDLLATTLAQNCYMGMFRFSNIKEAKILPATTLAPGCYAEMFRAQKSAIHIPHNMLPATTLATSCYSGMFGSCPITEIPSDLLPSTTLAQSCYASMFIDCTALTYIPDRLLPATLLADYCYQNMFTGCSSLTRIPRYLLPATTHIDETSGNEVTNLASSCYRNMFSNCTALTYIPDRLLPSTALAVDCYMNMFKGCTSITRVPSNLLPATALADDCYQSMFEGCTSLVSLPYGLLPAMTMVNYAYKTMFKGCTSLRSIPGNLLPATTLSSNCYESMFEGCSSLLNVPSVLPAANVSALAYRQMFKGCSSITEIPKGFLHATYINKGGCQSMFEGCSSLTEIGSPLLIENTRLAGLALGQMFKGCTALVSVDKGLLPTSNFNGASVYFGMFQGCTSLTNTIKFTDVVAQSCYESMYEGCTALTDFEDLPATALASSCYKAMFKGTGITTLSGKHLPAEQTSLAISSVYQSMFESCESLTFVPDDFIGLKNFQTQYCCKRMFAGCKKLSEAPYFNPTNLSAGSHAFEEMYIGCYGEETVNGETVYTGLTRMRPIGSNTLARLPFTNAGQLAFASMFSGCKLMTEIPIIDVEYLEGTGVFEYMYYGCTALETIPNGMFAKVLKKQSGISDASAFAMSMFEGCTSLDSTKIPSNLISAQTIEDGGYLAMFRGCTSIKTPVALPSVKNYYSYMYQGCTSLKSIATMDANLAGYYRYMYQGCTGLTTVDNLPDLTSANGKIRDYTGFFKDCTSLTSVPTVQGTDVRCSEMFSGCKALTSVALNLTFSESNAEMAGSCYKMFYESHIGRVTGTITINSMVDDIANNAQFGCMFQNCITLVELPTFTVNATTAGHACYTSMFSGCKVLPTVQKALTSGITTLAPYCYASMYRGCSAITAIPDNTLPATTAASYCYASMFNGSGITEVKDGAIAFTRMANACCSHMFYNCKALTKAYVPDKVETSCYEYMFSGCTALAEIHCLINIPTVGTSYTLNWTTDVAAQGVFYKNKTAYWPKGNHGIPTNWTIIDVIV